MHYLTVPMAEQSLMRQTLPQPKNNVNKTITRSVPEIENTTDKHTHTHTHAQTHGHTLRHTLTK